MFSGIIENRGKVVKNEKKGGQIRFGFKLERRQGGIKIGESIAVDGVCLTVVKVKGQIFEVDVVRETLKATTLGILNLGDFVNLERSLRFGDLVGGHLVTGHIDSVGRVEKIEKQGKNQLWTFRGPREIIGFLALKGSVAVDGISLTIQSLGDNTFDIALIPHTLKVTTLGQKKAQDLVNLEVDLIARYLSRILNDQGNASSPLRLSELAAKGF